MPAPRHRTTSPVTRETSAGGLVVRTGDGIPAAAVIGRLDRRGRMRWSLPKGHVEPGESREHAAVREVAEETGIHGRITAPLGNLAYSFAVGGRRIHKRVHHYLMVAEHGELSAEDVEVSAVAWVPLEELPDLLAHAAERRLVRLATAMLADTA